MDTESQELIVTYLGRPTLLWGASPEPVESHTRVHEIRGAPSGVGLALSGIPGTVESPGTEVLVMRRADRPKDARGCVAGWYADARHLALEIAGAPGPHIDPMATAVVLEDGEIARRVVDVWLSIWLDGAWAPGSQAQVLISDRRLLVRLDAGELVSMWWDTLVGFTADLAAGHVVLDFGDGRPRSISGPGAAAVAVAGVARLYGIAALLTHPALEPLRQGRLEEPVRST